MGFFFEDSPVAALEQKITSRQGCHAVMKVTGSRAIMPLQYPKKS
jgi:hypothetical protein